jgi:hypothetical protein
VKASELSFCCNSRSNRKTQPYYWLATDHNNKDKKKNRLTERERKTKGKENMERLRTSGLTRSSPLTRLKAKSF